MLRVILWNVNGLRAVEKKGALDELIQKYDPDVFVLNEIKGTVDKFPQKVLSPAQYETFYHSAQKPGYAGVGIWVKKADYLQVDEFFAGLEGREDVEGRVAHVLLRAHQKPLHIVGCYFPNGGKSPDAFSDKLVFYQDFLNTVNNIRDAGETCIWTGDVNCAHNPIDLARPKENEGKVGFHPDERAWMDEVVRQGWVDVFRTLYPEKRDIYSWWSMQTRARPRNVGWRIDYFFLNHADLSGVQKIEYLHQQMGSDHCPVVLELSSSFFA